MAFLKAWLLSQDHPDEVGQGTAMVLLGLSRPPLLQVCMNQLVTGACATGQMLLLQSNSGAVSQLL